MNISMDFDDKKLMRGFVNIEKANTIATRNTLNTMAALTRRNAINNLHSDFINRNTFTRRQIQFEKTESNVIANMESRTGATEKADYMALQEEGGLNRPKKGPNLAIPHNRARNGSRSSLVARQNYQRRVKSKRVRGRFKKNLPSRKSRIVAIAAVADRTGKFIKTSGGIYTVDSFRSKTNRKGKHFVTWNNNMIYNTKRRSVNIRSTPWLEPATEKPIRDGQAIFNSQVDKLLKGDVI